MAMIFQETMTSINPSFAIGEQDYGTILRTAADRGARRVERAIELLRRVTYPSPTPPPERRSTN